MHLINKYKFKVIDYVTDNKPLLIKCGACFIIGCVVGYSGAY